MSSAANRLINLTLRATTLASKFALLFFLAKFLNPTEVGQYGLLAASISFALMAIGFDFYTFATRELIATNRTNWAGMLRDQGIFYGITYATLIPLCLLVFSQGLLPWTLAIWFFPLLALEHIAQELNRLLVAISQPLWASIILFVRHGAWAVIVAISMLVENKFRSLNFVLSAWIVGVFLACLIGYYRLRELNSNSINRPINWAWIRSGIRIATPFLVATLSLRALYTVDRYWIEAIGSLDQLAAYVLFCGISNAIMSFLDAAVFTFSYPALISSANKGDLPAFNQQIRRLGLHTITVTFILSICAILCARTIVEWLDHPNYIQHFDLLYWIVLATAISGISMIPHYGLYARQGDQSIICSHLISLPIFGISTATLVPIYGITAIPIGMSIAFLFILVFKIVAFRRCSALVSVY